MITLQKSLLPHILQFESPDKINPQFYNQNEIESAKNNNNMTKKQQKRGYPFEMAKIQYFSNPLIDLNVLNIQRFLMKDF